MQFYHYQCDVSTNLNGIPTSDLAGYEKYVEYMFTLFKEIYLYFTLLHSDVSA